MGFATNIRTGKQYVDAILFYVTLRYITLRYVTLHDTKSMWVDLSAGLVHSMFPSLNFTYQFTLPMVANLPGHDLPGHDLPGHGIVPHSLISVSFPRTLQSFPCPCGFGFMQALVLDIIPPPHSAEQPDHRLHSE